MRPIKLSLRDKLPCDKGDVNVSTLNCDPEVGVAPGARAGVSEPPVKPTVPPVTATTLLVLVPILNSKLPPVTLVHAGQRERAAGTCGCQTGAEVAVAGECSHNGSCS